MSAGDSSSAGKGAAQALIRAATQSDAPTINAIYNHYVANSTATFAETPMALAERKAWLAALRPPHGVWVAVDANDDSRVLGWASLVPYHTRCAYRFTAEDSIYLAPEFRGLGLGRRLLTHVVEHARQTELHSLLAIMSAESAASIRLHASLGYIEVGRLREVGFKFERRIDVLFYQLLLRDHP